MAGQTRLRSGQPPNDQTKQAIAGRMVAVFQPLQAAFVGNGSHRQNRGQEAPTQPRSGDGTRQRLRFRGRQPLPEDDQGDRNHQPTVGIVRIDEPDRGQGVKVGCVSQAESQNRGHQGPEPVSARVSRSESLRGPLESRFAIDRPALGAMTFAFIVDSSLSKSFSRSFDCRKAHRIANHLTSRHQARNARSPSHQWVSRLDHHADSVPMGCKSIPDGSEESGHSQVATHTGLGTCPKHSYPKSTSPC